MLDKLSKAALGLGYQLLRSQLRALSDFLVHFLPDEGERIGRMNAVSSRGGPDGERN